MDGFIDCTDKCQIAFARSHEEFFRVCENDNVVIVELVPFDKSSAAYIYTESVDDPYACYTINPDYRQQLHRKISESLNEFKCVNRNF
uniref:DUF3885 domain-containing protein n=1 Tax=Steinernema glaseri TaxID=37863 RepID=A0A1I7YPQ9_9BILA